MRPAGRLFIRLVATAMAVPAPHAVQVAERSASSCRTALSLAINPVLSSASTRTKSPATSGSTPHEMPLSMSQGAFLSRIRTTTAVAAPAMAVGSPSCTSMAEAASSAIAVAAMPSAAVLPLPDRVGTDTSAAISCARASRCVHRSMR